MCKLIVFISTIIIAVSNSAFAQQNDYLQPQSLDVDSCLAAPLILANWHALSPLLLLPIFGFSLWGLFRLWEKGEPTSAPRSTSKQKLATGSIAGLASSDQDFLKDLAAFGDLKTSEDENAFVISEPHASAEQTWSDIEMAADLKKSPVEFLGQLDVETVAAPQGFDSIASLYEDLPSTKANDVQANDVRDDLIKIHGLGKASQKVLNNNGICSFAQVASMTSQQLDTLFDEEQKRFQLVDKGSWPLQAQRFIDTQSKEVSSFNLEMEILDEIDSLREIATDAMTSSSTQRETNSVLSRD